MQRFVDHLFWQRNSVHQHCWQGVYRCIMATWRAGKQFLVQPAFASSDRKFNTCEFNRSSTWVSDRSGNERAVNVTKCPGIIKRSLRPHESRSVIADENLVAPTCVCKERSQAQHMRVQSIVNMGIRSIWQRNSCQRGQMSGRCKVRFAAEWESQGHCRRLTSCFGISRQSHVQGSALAREF
jgi:hypothetical protein